MKVSEYVTQLENEAASPTEMGSAETKTGVQRYIEEWQKSPDFNESLSAPVIKPAVQPLRSSDAPTAQPKTSTATAFGLGAARSVVPGAAGLAAFAPGAALGAKIGALGGPVGIAAGGLIGGLASSYLAAKGTAAVQEAVVPTTELERTAQQEHPTAAMLGGVAGQSVTGGFNPLRAAGAVKTLGKLGTGGLKSITAAEGAALKDVGGGAVISAGMGAAERAIQGQDTTTQDILTDLGLGALSSKPTALGRKFEGLGAKAATLIPQSQRVREGMEASPFRGGPEAEAGIEEAPLPAGRFDNNPEELKRRQDVLDDIIATSDNPDILAGAKVSQAKVTTDGKDPSSPAHLARAMEQVARPLGQEVIMVEGAPLVNGIYTGQTSKGRVVGPDGKVTEGTRRVILVSADAMRQAGPDNLSAGVFNTFGHEVWHDWKSSTKAETDPLTIEAIKRVEEVVRKSIPKEVLANRSKELRKLDAYKNITEDALFEEHMGDLLGEAFGRKDFWYSVKGQSPTAYQRLVSHIVRVLENIGFEVPEKFKVGATPEAMAEISRGLGEVFRTRLHETGRIGRRQREAMAAGPQRPPEASAQPPPAGAQPPPSTVPRGTQPQQITKPSEPANAVQKPESTQVLQRQPEAAGEAGGQRGQVEPGEQGQEAAQQSKEEIARREIRTTFENAQPDDLTPAEIDALISDAETSGLIDFVAEKSEDPATRFEDAKAALKEKDRAAAAPPPKFEAPKPRLKQPTPEESAAQAAQVRGVQSRIDALTDAAVKQDLQDRLDAGESLASLDTALKQVEPTAARPPEPPPAAPTEPAAPPVVKKPLVPKKSPAEAEAIAKADAAAAENLRAQIEAAQTLPKRTRDNLLKALEDVAPLETVRARFEEAVKKQPLKKKAAVKVEKPAPEKAPAEQPRVEPPTPPEAPAAAQPPQPEGQRTVAPVEPAAPPAPPVKSRESLAAAVVEARKAAERAQAAHAAAVEADTRTPEREAWRRVYSRTFKKPPQEMLDRADSTPEAKALVKAREELAAAKQAVQAAKDELAAFTKAAPPQQKQPVIPPAEQPASTTAQPGEARTELGDKWREAAMKRGIDEVRAKNLTDLDAFGAELEATYNGFMRKGRLTTDIEIALGDVLETLQGKFLAAVQETNPELRAVAEKTLTPAYAQRAFENAVRKGGERGAKLVEAPEDFAEERPTTPAPGTGREVSSESLVKKMAAAADVITEQLSAEGLAKGQKTVLEAARAIAKSIADTKPEDLGERKLFFADEKTGEERLNISEVQKLAGIKRNETAKDAVNYLRNNKEVRDAAAKFSAREPDDRTVSTTFRQRKGIDPHLNAADSLAKTSDVFQALKDDNSPEAKDVLKKWFDYYRYFPQYREVMKGKSHADALDAVVNTMADNIRFVWDKTPEQVREIARTWYVGANKLAKGLADETGYAMDRVAAVVAAFSPNNEWDSNLWMAQTLVRRHKQFSTENTVVSAEMAAKMRSTAKTKFKEGALNQEQYNDRITAINTLMEGRRYNDLPAAIKALLINGLHFREQRLSHTPDGHPYEVALRVSGKPKATSFGFASILEESINLLDGSGSLDDISRILGDANKVRNFYNNILNPNDPRGFVTIDVHAIAVAHLSPMSGESPEVKSIFGQGGSGGAPALGANGSYALVERAFRLVAERLSKELGTTVLPREVQSATWDSIRGVFESKQAVRPDVEAVWKEYRDGKISIESVRQKIYDIARAANQGELPLPDWFDPTTGKSKERIAADSFAGRDSGAWTAGNKVQLAVGSDVAGPARVPARPGTGGDDTGTTSGRAAEEPRRDVVGEGEAKFSARQPTLFEDEGIGQRVTRWFLDKNLAMRAGALKKLVPTANKDLLEAVDRAVDLYPGTTGEEVRQLAVQHVDPLVKNLERLKQFMTPQAIATISGANSFARDFMRKAATPQHPVRKFLAKAQELTVGGGRSPTAVAADLWLYARHAQEANAYQRSVDPSVTAGSGMTDAEAAQILRAFSAAGLDSKLAPIGKRVDALNKLTRDTWLKGELLPAQAVADLDARFKHYVPLKGDQYNEMARGTGFQISGKETFRREGRTTAAFDILGHTIAQAEQAIDRKVRNLTVGRAMYDLVKSVPSGPWQELKPGMDGGENVFIVKKNGVEKRIAIDEDIAPMLLRSLKNLDPQQLSRWASTAHTIVRGYGNLLTSWNPEFALPNLARDFQDAFANAAAENQKVVVKALANPANGIRSMRGLAQALRNNVVDADGRAAAEFLAMGGAVGKFNRESAAQVSRDIRMELEGTALAKGAKSLVDGMEYMNRVLENSTRLTVYKSLVAKGVSKTEAARVAKNITVNFDRRGEMTPWMNTAFLFFNASAQGTARVAKALSGPNGRKIAAALFAIGYASDSVNRGISGDDNDDGRNDWDEKPDYTKENNLIIPLQDGKDIRIPLPYGWNIFVNMGRKVSEYQAGVIDEKKGLTDLLKYATRTFSPVGDAPLMPTLMRPYMELSRNKDWKGDPIYPENMFDKAKTPASEVASRKATGLSKDIASKLNVMTGGTAVEPGWISIHPDVMDYLAGYMTGGTGKFIGRAVEIPTKVKEGELQRGDIPVVRRLFSATPKGTGTTDFYEIGEKIDTLHARIKEYRERKEFTEANRLRDENRGLFSLKGRWDATRKSLKNLRARLDNADTPEERQTIRSQIDRLVAANLKVYVAQTGEVR